ncbi:type I restriction-modification enzyme R subunit C-terminal domain-containing protein [Vibrio sp. 10N.261.51.F11]
MSESIESKYTFENVLFVTRSIVLEQADSWGAFLDIWNSYNHKSSFIDELSFKGVLWEELALEIGKDIDFVDIVGVVVFGREPLTRKERADNVKKRNYFTKYGDTAQQVLNNLLDKYADEGVQEIENIHVLKVKPFDEMGRPLEIIKKGFGGKLQYLEAVNELEAAIYQSA